MKPTDKKLYELFGKLPKYSPNSDWWYTVEPQLHDVFRVAKEIWSPQISNDYDELRITKNLNIDADSFHKIPYNPTLSLINQSEETKLSIINLFTND
jgi:hypothetical protein